MREIKSKEVIMTYLTHPDYVWVYANMDSDLNINIKLIRRDIEPLSQFNDKQKDMLISALMYYFCNGKVKDDEWETYKYIKKVLET